VFRTYPVRHWSLTCTMSGQATVPYVSIATTCFVSHIVMLCRWNKCHSPLWAMIWGKVIPVQAMKASAGGATDTRSLNLGTRWKRVVSFTPWPLYPREKNCGYPSNRRLDRPQSRYGGNGKEETQTQSKIQIFFSRPTRSLVNIPITMTDLKSE